MDFQFSKHPRMAPLALSVRVFAALAVLAVVLWLLKPEQVPD